MYYMHLFQEHAVFFPGPALVVNLIVQEHDGQSRANFGQTLRSCLILLDQLDDLGFVL